MDREALLLAFDSGGSRAVRPEPVRAQLGSALASFVERGRTAWPGVTVDDAAFVRYVAERLPNLDDPAASLVALDAAGLYLACACVGADPIAIACLAETIRPQIDRTLQRMRIEPAQREDQISALQRREIEVRMGRSLGW